MSDIVQKLCGFCHTPRHDDVAFPQPGRAKDNSPAIYRWVSGREENESRQGRKEHTRVATQFLSPLWGFWPLRTSLPSVETVGFYRTSLRD
jgi:hypothetical protein